MRSVYRNFAQVITLNEAHRKDGRNLNVNDLSIIENASIIVEDSKILWVGRDSELVSKDGDKVVQCHGKIVLPEFVDSHTHLLYAGDRSQEYLMRLNGAQYEEIAKAGGGILNSQKAFGESSEDNLIQLCYERINRIKSYGVGTIEIKSGYGLSFDLEYKAMKVLEKVRAKFKDISICRTFMAAHAVPKIYQSSADYMEKVVLPLFDKVAQEGLADFVDIFHENGYFDKSDVENLFHRALKLNINRRIHADEFNDNGGGLLATQFNCHSADHLLATSDESISALAKSSTVATLLPGTGFFLGKKQSRARDMLDQGCKIAIASDYNPGSCHFDNLFSIACFSAPTLKFNPCELIAAITLNPAHSLGLENQGAIVPGLEARLSVFNCQSLAHLIYDWGINHFDFFIRD